MKKVYAIGNLVVVLGVVVWNYFANVGEVNGNTVGGLSDKYANLFTPAGYAFSIWGLIYMGLLAHCVFQIKRVFFDKQDDDFVLRVGPWLMLANLGNAIWLWFWLHEQTGLSVVTMLVILVSLLATVVRLGIGRSGSSKAVMFWGWRPVELYAGWIAVATIANVSAFLAKMGWQAGSPELMWTVVMLVVAALVNIAVVFSRRMVVFAGVGVWAILAIAVRHAGEILELQWVAVGCAIAIVVGVVVKLLGKQRLA